MFGGSRNISRFPLLISCFPDKDRAKHLTRSRDEVKVCIGGRGVMNENGELIPLSGAELSPS